MPTQSCSSEIGAFRVVDAVELKSLTCRRCQVTVGLGLPVPAAVRVAV